MQIAEAFIFGPPILQVGRHSFNSILSKICSITLFNPWPNVQRREISEQPYLIVALSAHLDTGVHILNLIAMYYCTSLENRVAWIVSIWVMRIFPRGLDRKTFWDQVPPPLQLGLFQTCRISPITYGTSLQNLWVTNFFSNQRRNLSKKSPNFSPALSFLLSFSAWSVLTANIFQQRLTFEISGLRLIIEPPQFQLF